MNQWETPGRGGEIEALFLSVVHLSLETNVTSLQRKDIPGWDSLRHAELILAAQNRFGIRFTVKEILSIDSFEALKKIILMRA